MKRREGVPWRAQNRLFRRFDRPEKPPRGRKAALFLFLGARRWDIISIMLRTPVGRSRSSKSAAAFLFILTENFTLRLRIGKSLGTSVVDMGRCRCRLLSGGLGPAWRVRSRIRQCSGCERVVTSCFVYEELTAKTSVDRPTAGVTEGRFFSPTSAYAPV